MDLALEKSPAHSLRLGELLGLPWDGTDITAENRAYVCNNKESQRVKKESLKELDRKDVLDEEYMDYNLVMVNTFGLLLGDGSIRDPLKKLIEDYNLLQLYFIALDIAA